MSGSAPMPICCGLTSGDRRSEQRTLETTIGGINGSRRGLLLIDNIWEHSIERLGRTPGELRCLVNFLRAEPHTSISIAVRCRQHWDSASMLFRFGQFYECTEHGCTRQVMVLHTRNDGEEALLRYIDTRVEQWTKWSEFDRTRWRRSMAGFTYTYAECDDSNDEQPWTAGDDAELDRRKWKA
jgi:hypothetical protein